jgi:hypothetical protein
MPIERREITAKYAERASVSVHSAFSAVKANSLGEDLGGPRSLAPLAIRGYIRAYAVVDKVAA